MTPYVAPLTYLQPNSVPSGYENYKDGFIVKKKKLRKSKSKKKIPKEPYSEYKDDFQNMVEIIYSSV